MAVGAQFLASPVTDPQVITLGRQHDLVSAPGAFTPAAMIIVHKAGAFGLGFVVSLFEPMDMTKHRLDAIAARAKRITEKVREFGAQRARSSQVTTA
jgi:2-keto-3-deoxy-6-phosphogluconate aldolase